MCFIHPTAFLFAFLISTTQGGNCWYSSTHSGKCTELMEQMVDKEACCSIKHMPTAWSTQDLDSGALFFWRVLGGGVPCTQCIETCEHLHCPPGKRCLMKKNRPTCVCWPACRTKEKRKGRVCGTDGRTYASLCRIKKKSCRARNPSLQVAYFGPCEKSCDRITCPAGKFCVLDQTKSPHCVRCSRTCPFSPSSPDQLICGVDGKTYNSICDIRAASCTKGKAIPIAYKGPCRGAATCKSVECSPAQRCLTNPVTGDPRCVTCNHRCPPTKKGHKNQYGGLVCGSNNRTYTSWCHMMKDACATGLVIETKHSGVCANEDIKLYKRRWGIETLFMAFSTVNAFQWAQYIVIEDVIRDYYNIKPYMVEWTAMSYSFCLSFFIIPWTCLLEKIGLRRIMLLACALNAAGAVMKLFSGDRDAWTVAFIGQWLVALGQLGFLPSRVAALWFGPDEVSTACAMGVIGNQIGVAIGFVLPPLLIKMNDDKSITKSQIGQMNYLVAGSSVVLLLLMYFGFEDQPKLPPSRAAGEQRKEKVDFLGALKRLSSNKGYLLLMVVYGLNIGVFATVATLLNRMVLAFFSNGAEHVGWIGLLSILGGGVGSFVAGYSLDKIGHYKEVAVGTCICSALSMLALGLTIDQGQIALIYLSSLGIGFFMTGFYTVGYEFCAELAYPENEGTSVGIMNGVSQSACILITLLGSWIIEMKGVVWCCHGLFFFQVLTTLVASTVPKNYKRQAMKTLKPSKADKCEKTVDRELKPLRPETNSV